MIPKARNMDGTTPILRDGDDDVGDDDDDGDNDNDVTLFVILEK